MIFRKTTLSFWLVLIILSACTPAPDAQPEAAQPGPPQETRIAVIAATLSAEVSTAAQATPPAPADVLPIPLTLDNLAAEEAPIRYTFPIPEQEPVSLWRPPLYDTPWALTPHDHFYFARPVAADEVNWPLDNYRYGAQFPGLPDVIHTGADFPAPRNTPILAAGPGVIMWAGWDLFDRQLAPSEDPYGIAVAIKHDFGYQDRRLYTVYAHMDRVDVVPGQRVETGDPLGIIGTTGFTTGPHVHFEVRIETGGFFASRNPELWMAPPQGWGVLAGRLMNTNGSLLKGHSLYVRSLQTNERRTIHSYSSTTKVTGDDYYQENLALSDLPAGDYELSIEYEEGTWFSTQITIQPGAVSYFSFRGDKGFSLNPPASPDAEDLLNPAP
ncbi:MAG: M23 family metallopeptidase [Anaerolineaceae bacterium]|jgi:murein DD-endopeptidase MepM/ murein hydrolase activator NlpD|nr:M23 family metallopeptidase [Anaerolineaceae bacterium]